MRRPSLSRVLAVLVLAFTTLSDARTDPGRTESEEPDARECHFCERCSDSPGRRRLPEVYPGIDLTPRLSNALFGDGELSPRDGGVNASGLPDEHGDAPVLPPSIAQLDEWVQASEGYDDDDFFDFVSGFPQDEARSVQYGKLLAEVGSRYKPELEQGSSDTTVPVGVDGSKQEEAKAAFRAILATLQAIPRKGHPQFPPHDHKHSHHTKSHSSSGSRASSPGGDNDDDDDALLYTYMANKDSRVNSTAAGKSCKACKGCTSELEVWGETTGTVTNKATEKTFVPPVGRSSTWIFRASTQKTASGTGVAKVWCLPFKKRHDIKVDDCEPRIYNATMGKLTAFNKLVHDCGMEEIVSSTWVEDMKAVMPNTGYVIDMPALMSDIAGGVSAKFLSKGKNKKEVLKIFEKIPSDAILKAAIFDLLVGNCDRHTDNVFIDENGRLTLIDNDMSLSGKCIANSVFLPGTQYHARESMAGAEDKLPKTSILDLLDYRCHTHNGHVRNNYPPSVRKCLGKINQMRVEDVRDAYGFPRDKDARHLKLRAQQLLTMGFEWTLFQSLPIEGGRCAKRFLTRAPCCRFKVNSDNRFQCAQSHWNPKPFAVTKGDCQK